MIFKRRAVEGSAPESVSEDQTIPPVVRRNTIYFALTQALQGSGTQLAITLSALMVVRLVGSTGLSGIGGSILGLSRFVIAYPTGKFSDAYGRRAGMMMALILGLAGTVLLGTSTAVSSFPIFIVGMVVIGLGTGEGTQLRVGAADMYPPRRRAEGLGFVLTGTVAGAFVAPTLVGTGELLSDWVGIDSLALSWFLVPLAIVPAIGLVLRVRPDPKEIGANLQRYWPSYQPAPSPPRATGSFTTFFRHRPKQVAYLCYAAAQGNMSMMMVMTPLVMSDSGHGLPAISFAVSLHVVGMFAFSILLGRQADRLGRTPLLYFGMAIQITGALLVPVSPIYFVITLGLFLVGLGRSAVNVAATAIVADTSMAEERGRAIGANDTFAGMFGIVVPAIGGVVANLTGLMGVGLAGAALAFLPVVMIRRLRESSPGRYDGEDASSQS